MVTGRIERRSECEKPHSRDTVRKGEQLEASNGAGKDGEDEGGKPNARYVRSENLERLPSVELAKPRKRAHESCTIQYTYNVRRMAREGEVTAGYAV